MGEILIWISSFMCLIGYLIIIGDNMSKVMSGGAYSNRNLWVTIGSIIAFPLCFLKQESLAFTSQFAIVVNIYLFGVVLYLALSDPAPVDDAFGPICYLGFGK